MIVILSVLFSSHDLHLPFLLLEVRELIVYLFRHWDEGMCTVAVRKASMLGNRPHDFHLRSGQSRRGGR